MQEKGYNASFPSLINVGGQATYIMVLKDSGGLVKLYALVNVEKYSVVATGQTQQEAMAAYRKMLEKNGIAVGTVEDIPKTTVQVSEVRLVTVEDMPTVYLTAEDGKVYKGYLNLDESLILIRTGDTISVVAESTQIDGLYTIRSWAKE